MKYRFCVKTGLFKLTRLIYVSKRDQLFLLKDVSIKNINYCFPQFSAVDFRGENESDE